MVTVRDQALGVAAGVASGLALRWVAQRASAAPPVQDGYGFGGYGSGPFGDPSGTGQSRQLPTSSRAAADGGQRNQVDRLSRI